MPVAEDTAESEPEDVEEDRSTPDSENDDDESDMDTSGSEDSSGEYSIQQNSKTVQIKVLYFRVNLTKRVDILVWRCNIIIYNNCFKIT